MRSPSLYSDQRRIDIRGANLPATVERLRRAESKKEQVYASLANKLSELIDDVRELRVRDDERTETFTLEVRGRDGVLHPAVSLSDGTLRFLVLATLAIDPETRGVICLEEPENGVHPERVPAMVRLLEDIAVDPEYAVDDDNPLRQVIINTHSPVVMSNVDREDVVYIDEMNASVGGTMGRVALPRVVAGTWRPRLQKDVLPLSLSDVRPYLMDSRGQILMDFLGVG